MPANSLLGASEAGALDSDEVGAVLGGAVVIEEFYVGRL
jgi:hypothetical protein